MKTKSLLSLLCALVVLITGCASVDVSNDFNGLSVDGSRRVAHINGNIWGIYILSIPLLYPYDEGTVDLDTCVNMVTKRARNLGATRVVDLQSDQTSLWLPFTFVGFYREVEVSATAIQ